LAESKSHRKQVKDALADEYLQTALTRAAAAYKLARQTAMDGFDLPAAQDEVRAVKERSIADMDALFARFKAEAERVGAVVHEAKDGEEAADIIRKLAEERGVKLIAKSKSMLTEEIELNPRLAKAGLDVVETTSANGSSSSPERNPRISPHRRCTRPRADRRALLQSNVQGHRRRHSQAR